MTSPTYVLVVVEEGLLESARVFEFSADALKKGHAIWIEETATVSMAEERDVSAAQMEEDEPGYDRKWGGVSRGHVMYWWTDDLDIWVVEAEA